jgi:alpha-tubulin suppressor-like RCC1 family protein
MRIRVGIVVALLVGSVVAALPSVPIEAQPAPEAAVANDWRSVSVGGFGACGIKTTGRLLCWGADDEGLVGDGLPRTAGQPAAVEVSGGGTIWKQVSVGADVACAVKTDGRMFCWGSDFRGTLGNGGADVDRASPFQVTGIGWSTVAVGESHSCAIKTAGSLWCWGIDFQGSLGLGSGAADDYDVPTRVGTASDWTSVSAAGTNTCGRRRTGRLYCWGSDGFGQVGNGGGMVPGYDVPTQVAGNVTTWAGVEVGSGHTCARRTNNRLYCWGRDDSGQLGDGGADADQDAPVAIGAANWASVDAGQGSTCARRTSGELFCWGADTAGALGDGGGEADSDVPVAVAGAASDWRTFSVGRQRACARKAAGRLLCWGDGTNGALGDGAGTPSSTSPVEVEDATAFTGVASGGAHACGLAGGRLWCWGDDDNGQLGSGGGPTEQLPVQVSGGVTTWSAIALGGDHSCGLRTTGRLYCWGDDDNGQLGNNAAMADTSTPVLVAGGFTDWTNVTAGLDHTCARREVGRLYCWGSDGSGRLGDGGAEAGSPTPVEVSGALTTWSRYLAAGAEHTCATRSTGRLYCWGADDAGQGGSGAGDGTTGVPVQVSGNATTWSSVTAGLDHTCATRSTGRLFCWGADGQGQLGDDPDLGGVEVPTEVAGAATDWAAVDAGDEHTCARKTTNRLLCWGDDASSQVGDGAPAADSPVPVEVDGALTRWSEVTAGGRFTCARMATKRLWCWGADGLGQTGSDTDTDQEVLPEQVLA